MTIAVTGITSNELEMKSGTVSGILIVKLRFLHQRYTSTATIAPNIDTNRPLEPSCPSEIPPASSISSDSSKNATSAIDSEPGTSSS